MFIMMKITSKEWNRQHKDYKSIINDQKYIMHNNGLEPVEIDDINGQEYRQYKFTEFGIAYTVGAYSESEAMDIIKSCGHYMPMVKDLQLAKTN
jgi:hypothetical protein